MVYFKFGHFGCNSDATFVVSGSGLVQARLKDYDIKWIPQAG